MRLALCLSVVLGLGLNPEAAFGCQCVAPPPGLKGPREVAEWRANHADSIFEATVKNVRLKSPLFEASAGDIVPASLDDIPFVMLVTFNVSRSYRGVQEHQVEVETGLGGGDCGFPFEIGRQYLVYAYNDDSGRLSTGICTATAPLEDSGINLAYLRGELLPEDSGQPSRAGGKLCVQIVKDGSVASDDDRLLLLRAGIPSPFPSGEEAAPVKKGTFCASNVDPGKYNLLFAAGTEESPTSFLYYPGVTGLSEATLVTIRPGQTIADLVFKIPPQPTFSVSGAVSTSNNSPLPKDVKVILISADQPFLTLTYSQDVAPDGSFRLPKILPGKYWGFLDVESDSESPGEPKWLTRKTEIVIDRDLSRLSLPLIPH